jgi:hypothetical protein
MERPPNKSMTCADFWTLEKALSQIYRYLVATEAKDRAHWRGVTSRPLSPSLPATAGSSDCHDVKCDHRSFAQGRDCFQRHGAISLDRPYFFRPEQDKRQRKEISLTWQIKLRLRSFAFLACDGWNQKNAASIIIHGS